MGEFFAFLPTDNKMSSVAQRHNISLGLCVISAIFCGLCYAGVKGDVPWTTIEVSNDSSTTKWWYGLAGFQIHQETTSNGVTTTTVDWKYTAYKDVDNDLAEDCETAGGVVISFATFGLAATVTTMLFVQKRKNSGGGGLTRIITMAATGFGAFCFLTAWSTWVGECHEKDLNTPGKDADLHAGFAMAFLGMCFMGLTALNELCVPNDPEMSVQA